MKKHMLPVIFAVCALMFGVSALARSGSPKAFQSFGDTLAPAPTADPSGSTRADLAEEVVCLVNAERARQGLRSLRVDADLTRAARIRAGELTLAFGHIRPDGSPWDTVSAIARGENIARGQNSAAKVMAAWVTSSTGHRENILRPSYGSIGVCAYRSGGILYWVQLFGR